MTDFICRRVYSLPLPILHIMWLPFLYLVDKPLCKIFGTVNRKTDRCYWYVEVVATMQNRIERGKQIKQIMDTLEWTSKLIRIMSRPPASRTCQKTDRCYWVDKPLCKILGTVNRKTDNRGINN